MKTIRYILGTIGFVVVWLGMAALVAWPMGLVFPPMGGFADDVLIWRSLPGNMLGIWLGHRFFRFIVRPSKTKA